MSAFEDFVQQELPKRGYLNSDVPQETLIIRRGQGPRQFDAIQLEEGQVVGFLNGQLAGVHVSDAGIGDNILRKAILQVEAPAAVWTITHNLGSENVIVQAFDQDKFVIIPHSIQIVSEDVVELTFNTAMTGTARVIFLD